MLKETPIFLSRDHSDLGRIVGRQLDMFGQHQLPQGGVTETSLKLEEQLHPGQFQRPASLLQSAQVIIKYRVKIHDDDQVPTRALVVLCS